MGPWTMHIYPIHCGKSTFAVTVQWTVTALLQNAWKPKKKKKKNENAASQTHTQFQWNPNTHYGFVWIEFIVVETENWKYCSKIIFKYVNSIVGPIFNIF